jgi:uncharacterized SAM-dependent methyltransferase
MVCVMSQITELEEYYPYRVELGLLQEHAPDIITHIPKGSVLVELGCGSASKTSVLQRALLARCPPPPPPPHTLLRLPL